MIYWKPIVLGCLLSMDEIILILILLIFILYTHITNQYYEQLLLGHSDLLFGDVKKLVFKDLRYYPGHKENGSSTQD